MVTILLGSKGFMQGMSFIAYSSLRPFWICTVRYYSDQCLCITLMFIIRMSQYWVNIATYKIKSLYHKVVLFPFHSLTTGHWQTHGGPVPPWVYHMATMMCGKNIVDELHCLDSVVRIW